MRKIKLLVSFGIFLMIILSVVFMVSIKDKLPNNIFCFLDIGTYKAPSKSVEINSSNSYGQSFISNFDNLFMMSIFIPRQNLDSNRELYFHLKKSKDDVKDLVVLKWKFNQIHFKKNDFYVVPPDRESTDKGFHFHFQVPTIKESKNRGFYLYFESPDAKIGEGIKLGVWDNGDYYEALTKGQMFINHRPTKGFLAFRTYNTWAGNPSFLIDEIKTRLLKDKVFLIFYCASLGFILSVVIITISLKIKNI